MWAASAETPYTTVGLTAGAVEYMTGFRLLKRLAPIEEAMAVMSFIDAQNSPPMTSDTDKPLFDWPSHGDRKPGSRHRHDEGDGCPGQSGKRRLSGVRVRQKPDACRKISEAFDRLIREKADSGHERNGIGLL